MKSIDHSPTGSGTTQQEFSVRTRTANIERMRLRTFDIAVIGGGITGAGVALDAASRGLSVALVEKNDFASGASSRSSKLIHGGLRYIGQFRISLVRQALSERAFLMRVAPHLAQPLGFLAPVYRKGSPSPLGGNRFKLGAGLTLYDLLAGRANIEKHRWLEPGEALRIAPRLAADDLRGAFLYYDCLTDDSRLVIEVIKTAASHGAVVANYAAAQSFDKTGKHISGFEVKDRLTGRTFPLRARVVVNASGVWSDEVASLAEGRTVRRLRPSKGIHLVLPSEKIACGAAVLIPSLGERRFLFVIPWLGRTLIGTTDTGYSGEIENPRAGPDEIERVLQSAARAFPNARLSQGDVISSFAGLRPLIDSRKGSTAGLSREDAIVEDKSGLISIIGGKLTTYRHMAERVVDRAARHLARYFGVRASARSSRTATISLTGPISRESDSARISEEFGVSGETVLHLIRTYGGNASTVLRIASSGDLKEKLSAELPHVRAEAVYAARHEMAVRVEDFLNRRTRIALLTRDHGSECAAQAGELLGVSGLAPIS